MILDRWIASRPEPLLSRYLLVLIGGGTGALARYVASSLISQRLGSFFPWGTFVINVTGSFVIGLLMTLLSERMAHPYWRLLLVVGFLGGYTTFSSFEWETFVAVRANTRSMAALNVIGSVVCGYIAVWLGAILAARR